MVTIAMTSGEKVRYRAMHNSVKPTMGQLSRAASDILFAVALPCF